jgi:L-rhamnose mutarotase
MKRNHLIINIFRTVIVTGLSVFIACNPVNQKTNVDMTEKKSNPDIKRIGMVIKLDSSRMKEYLGLHADSNAGVRDLLEKYNLRNFSIFITTLDDGNYYEFGYYEYTGKNYEADMAALDNEPRNKEWLKICDPMQIPLKGETSWKKMKQVYFNK